MVSITSRYLQLLVQGHRDFILRVQEAERYYRNDNAIRKTGASQPYQDGRMENPLRLADNRISHNWHNLLVNQKTGYLLTYPPTFDVGNKEENQIIADTLGDQYAQVSSSLGIAASNAGVGWLHYWRGGDGAFEYAVVSAEQIVPILSADLKAKLEGVVRCYTMLEPDGEHRYCEYWDAQKAVRYRENANGNYAFYPYIGGESHTIYHRMGAVPFIPFYNNSLHTGDLPMVKDLIDAYDKVVSGFANDIDDVQEVIFVLREYGGADKEEFIRDLKLKKVIKIEGDGGADTIRAEIPYEARGAFLDRTRKQIFVSGMGVDPDPQAFGDASGVALKFLYSLLELKAGMMEAEFRRGYAELVRAICRFKGLEEPKKIIQTWTRNAIQNDLETAQIAQQSTGVISRRTILKNHPWVEDAEAEEKQVDKEQAAEAQYTFPKQESGADADEE